MVPCGARGSPRGFALDAARTTYDDDTKSRPGRRAVGLPAELVALLVKHREEQERERATAAQLWRDSGYVFTTPVGEPVNPNTDYHHWKRLLADAGPVSGMAGSTTLGTRRRRCC